MAQHGASGKHSANNTSSDMSSQETKKIDRTETADETKEMPKASSKSMSRGGIDATDKTVKFNAATAQKTVKPVTSGAAEAEAAATKKRGGIIAAIIAIIIVIAAVIGFMAMNSNNASNTPSSDLEVVDVAVDPIDNPIDFAALQAQNPDVYAYMNIPNTNIDLPILFSAENDNYYLTHDIDGNSTIIGAIYSQSMNTQDFTDPVTVLYGHTLLNGTMFSELHQFENPEFFEQNPYFNVYLPTEALTYEVVSAIEYDDRHIMNTLDFTNEQVLQDFYDSMLTADPNKTDQVREGAELKAGEDNIIVLSTCTQPANDSRRFLVIGKLMSITPTK